MSLSLSSDFEMFDAEASKTGDPKVGELRARYWSAKRKIKKLKKVKHRPAAKPAVPTGAPTSSRTKALMERVHRTSVVETFCGCGRLSSFMEEAGFDALGIDYAGNKDKPTCKHIYIDLSTPSGQAAFWTIIAEREPVFVHFAPPCGTASRARDIRRKVGPDPKPL
eukprot:12416494-Karenia_brevis.AAC.1